MSAGRAAGRGRPDERTRMWLRAGAATDIGRARELNEDAYVARVEQGLFVVCDGMGGAAAGEVASRLAVDTIVECLAGGAGRAEAAGGFEQYRPRTRRLAGALHEANRRIFEQAELHAHQSGMGTTVVAAWFDQHIVSLAHVGDSRAYLWRGGRLTPLTRDHSLVEAQVSAGLLDREQSLQSGDQNILLCALGREPEVQVEVAEVPGRPGDCVLLCSDGLTRMVPEPLIVETLASQRTPQRMCNALVEAANRNGGLDNITVVIVKMAGGWWRRLRRRLSTSRSAPR